MCFWISHRNHDDEWDCLKGKALCSVLVTQWGGSHPWSYCSSTPLSWCFQQALLYQKPSTACLWWWCLLFAPHCMRVTTMTLTSSPQPSLQSRQPIPSTKVDSRDEEVSSSDPVSVMILQQTSIAELGDNPLPPWCKKKGSHWGKHCHSIYTFAQQRGWGPFFRWSKR